MRQPIGLMVLIAGLLASVSLVFVPGRQTGPLPLAGGAVLLGAGLAGVRGLFAGRLWSTSPLRGAAYGLVSGLLVTVFHTKLTNPDACASLWITVLFMEAPVVGVLAAAGSWALTRLQCLGGTLRPPLSGAFVLLTCIAVIVWSAVTLLPVCVDALSRPGSRVRLEIERVEPVELGYGSLVLGDRVLSSSAAEWYQLFSAYCSVMSLDGAMIARFPLPLGGTLCQDKATGLPFTWWWEPSPGADGVYQAALQWIDVDHAGVGECWVLPPGFADVHVVHDKRVVASAPGAQLSCFAFDTPEEPTMLWQMSCLESCHVKGGERTFLLVFTDRRVICIEAQTGRTLWAREDGAPFADAVWDPAERRWFIALTDGVVAVNAATGEETWRYRAVPFLNCWDLRLLSGRLIAVCSLPVPDVKTASLITALAPESGECLWIAEVDPGAGKVVGESEGIVFVTARNFLLGLDAGTGARLIRGRFGTIHHVMEHNGQTILLGQGPDGQWGFHIGRIVRR